MPTQKGFAVKGLGRPSFAMFWNFIKWFFRVLRFPNSAEGIFEAAPFLCRGYLKTCLKPRLMQFIHALPFPLTLLHEDITFRGPCGRCVLMKLVSFCRICCFLKKRGECFAPPSPPIGGVPQVLCTSGQKSRLFPWVPVTGEV